MRLQGQNHLTIMQISVLNDLEKNTNIAKIIYKLKLKVLWRRVGTLFGEWTRLVGTQSELNENAKRNFPNPH